MKSKRQYPTLRAWRDELGLTQPEAGALLGLTTTSYCRIENRKQTPRAKKAKAISERAGVPLESVLGIS